MDFYEQLWALLRRDETGRGLARWLPAPDFDALTDTLLSAERAVILTGFPVDCGGVFHGETDGPSGAANLARALMTAGCNAILLCGSAPLPQVQAAADVLAPGTEIVCLPDRVTAAFAQGLLNRIRPTHFFTIEHPGKSADDHFYNMHGCVIDDMVTDAEIFLPLARRMGAVTVAVGDGGNELGLGALRPVVEAHVPHGKRLAAVERADFTMVSGVSNWWGWAAAALLSAAIGQRLLPTPEEERMALEAVVASGGVDGCTGKSTLSVDALPLSFHLEQLRHMEDTLCTAPSRTLRVI
ncbi:DUF4392 domain-containing protein [Oscillibacter sp.]|uniref:DUF4392 domain-containing protein n=1 Tax=Oscillibacter sp. TaxID=1945593 RepID=UPI0028AE7310|nr:DUF4392 domain-containing protein [Oscillibacter sp.]